nr:hypothetical protein [uncultured Flavobacterium sp.]
MPEMPIYESVLLRTSSANDVKNSGGTVSITGLNPIFKNFITSIVQVKYRAEVVQVATIGSNSYVPAGATLYQVAVFDPNRRINGANEQIKYYGYTTPDDVTTLGATAALQREAIHAKIITAINADATNYSVAVTLGTGTGFTVTDDGGYYPVHSQTMTRVIFVNTVLCTNGFTAAPTISTAGNFSVGVGSKLASAVGSADWMNAGNLVSGYPFPMYPKTTTGLPAVSGQNYDLFVINSLTTAPNETASGQQVALVNRVQSIYVDNGTGSSTTNLTGFKTFERSMLHEIFKTFNGDNRTIYFLGDTGPTCGGLNTGLPSGTSLAENFIQFGNGFSTHYYPLGTSTLVALTSTNDGIGIVLDATAGKGAELSAPTWTNSLKNFVVGQTAASIYCKVTIDDVSGLNPFWVGFRVQGAANTTYTSYTDYAFVGLGNATGDIFTSYKVNSSGAAVDTTQNWADAETHTLEVRVDINGAVTFKIDGYAPTTTQALTFDSGDVMIPVFGYGLQTADIGTPSVLEGAFVTSNSWRS